MVYGWLYMFFIQQLSISSRLHDFKGYFGSFVHINHTIIVKRIRSQNHKSSTYSRIKVYWYAWVRWIPCSHYSKACIILIPLHIYNYFIYMYLCIYVYTCLQSFSFILCPGWCVVWQKKKNVFEFYFCQMPFPHWLIFFQPNVKENFCT